LTDIVDLGKKKRRISAACSECKKKHAKCNGALPCDKCRSQGRECVYTPQRKRGAKPRNDNEKVAALMNSMHKLVNPIEPKPFSPTPSNIVSSLTKLQLQVKQRKKELLSAFNIHAKPFFPSLKIPSFEQVREGSEDEFLMFTVLAIGAIVCHESDLAKELVEHSQHMLNHTLFNSSINIGNGLLMLAYYYTCSTGIDKGYSIAELSYRLSQKTVITLENQSELAALQGRALAKMVAFAVDTDDRDYYFSRSKKLLTHPTDLLVLICSMVRNEVARCAHESLNITFLHSMGEHIQEGEDILRRVQPNHHDSEGWIYSMFDLMLSSLKSVYYLLLGDQQTAHKIACQTLNKFQNQPHYECVGFPFTLAYIIKVFFEVQDDEKLHFTAQSLQRLSQAHVPQQTPQLRAFVIEHVFKGFQRLAARGITDSNSWKWMELLFFPRLRDSPSLAMASNELVDFSDQVVQSFFNDLEVKADIQSFLSMYQSQDQEELRNYFDAQNRIKV